MEGSTSSQSSTFSAEQFFATQEPPPKLARVLADVETFVTGHARAGRRVVLVTVGVYTIRMGWYQLTLLLFLERWNDGPTGA